MTPLASWLMIGLLAVLSWKLGTIFEAITRKGHNDEPDI